MVCDNTNRGGKRQKVLPLKNTKKLQKGPGFKGFKAVLFEGKGR